MKKLWVLAAVASCIALGAHSQQQQKTQTDFDGKTWWDYVKVLADDKMEGRETGSEGLKRAEAYVVEQLKNSGVEPAGSNEFYQPVKFESRQIIEKDSSIALIHDGKTEPLVLGDDAFFSTRIDLAPEVEAPLVFVGYGLSIPEKSYNDFAGLDLKGKIAVSFAGSPAEMPGALASHYQSAGERWKALKAAGAIGIVALPNPASMDIPWSRISLNRAHPEHGTRGHQPERNRGRTDFDYLQSRERREIVRRLRPHVRGDRRAGQRSQASATVSAGDVAQGRCESGKDGNRVSQRDRQAAGKRPSLKNEYVVLSAHIDHLGIGEPINGDKIYNGAMDNGSGSALLLDVARSMKQDPASHKRSILFVFVCGEEKGLLGSKYFAAHPTVPAKSIVADINTDMFLPLIPLKILTVYGLQESDLGDDGAPGGGGSRSSSAARSAAATQLFSFAAISTASSATEFRALAMTVGSDARFARCRNLQELADAALPRAFRRCEPARGFVIRCRV